MPTLLGKVHCTMPHPCEGQYPSSTMPIDAKNTMIMVQPTAQPTTSFRTTTPSTAMTGKTTTKQVNPVQVHCPPICLCWLLVRKEKKFLSAVTVCLYSVSHVVHP